MSDTSLQPSGAIKLPAERFLDRELSWLAFNNRVLELAQDENMELLERVKYLQFLPAILMSSSWLG